jgi:hypothetical protein
MTMNATQRLSALWLLVLHLALAPLQAASPNCSQTRLDGTTPPGRTYTITPAQTVTPFYQWQSNNGYCGEVSLIQAGLNHGQWLSQYQARLLCGTGLLQAGPRGWCQNHQSNPHHNAQLLLETPNTGVTGPYLYANAATCLQNARLEATHYPYSTGFRTPNLGLSGYRDFLSWVKQEMIAGHQVTIGVLAQGADDPQYGHIVSVTAIGTNHPRQDAAYYDDDVLYFDDHGSYNLHGDEPALDNPAIPLGAGKDLDGCTPYIFGYTFESLGKTWEQANRDEAQAYSILIPGVPTETINGGDGRGSSTLIIGHNYGFSVSGAIDNTAGGRALLPVQISIPAATRTGGKRNPRDPVAGWQYENSMIGTSTTGDSCTNTPPRYAMRLPLQVTLTGLTPGIGYNLYEYDLKGVKGQGAAAALTIPTDNFNQNAARASKVTRFTATTDTYTQRVIKRSDQIVIFRAVPQTAP